MSALVPVLLLAAIPLFAQSTPNPQFRETAVIPFFHKRDREISHFRTFYRKDLDGTHSLLLVRGGREEFRGSDEYFWGNRHELLGLFLMKTGDPELAWELAIFSSAEGGFSVERVDDRSIVLRTTADYGLTGKIKFSYDVTSKRVLKRLNFSPVPVQRILSWKNKLYFVIGIPEDFKGLARLQEDRPVMVEGAERNSVLAPLSSSKSQSIRFGGQVLPSGLPRRREYRSIRSQGRFAALLDVNPYTDDVEEVEGVAERVGDEFKLHRLPKSTFEELARYRPSKARPHQRSGLPIDENDIFETEGIGPYQISGNRFWFGKSFADAEGLTGIGGFGYFDPDKKKYIVLSPPEIIHWSVSALLVEGPDIWLGLVRHPEGADYSGGLLRYGRFSAHVDQFDVDEVITQIKRWRGRLYLATTDGLFVWKDHLLTHYVFEPALDGDTEIFPLKSQPLRSW